MSSAPSANPQSEGLIRLRMFVAGGSPNSLTALANLRGALADHPDIEVELEIIDVLREPERGLRDGVLVTPMLVKIAPLPERRILGNLRDRAALLGVLGRVEMARD